MSGLKRHTREEMPESMRETYDWVHRLTGQAAYVEAIASAPELMDFTMSDFYQKIFYEGRCEVRFKELARLRMSLGHGCRSCNLGNSQGAREAGYSDHQLENIEGDRSVFDDAERAVLALADEMLMTNQQGHMSQALYNELKRHFDDAEILELGTVTSFLVGLAKFLFVFDLAEKEDYCVFKTDAA
jgi:alkylhydroperoxidase family enzyme